MTSVKVQTAAPYAVEVGAGLLERAGETARSCWKGPAAAVVTDSNVAPLYLERCLDSLRAAGLRAVSFVFPAGEASKNGKTYLELLEFLDRKSVV